MIDNDRITRRGADEDVACIGNGKSRFRWQFWPTFFVVYFGIRLLPEWFPSITGGDFWLIYDNSWLLIAILILGFEVFGILACSAAPLRGKGVSKRGKASLRIAGWGLAIGILSIPLIHVVRRGLPSASYVLDFDSKLWLAESECRDYKGLFSARQLMCGSLLDKLEPGMSFEEIIKMLGSPRIYDMARRTMSYPLGSLREPLASDAEELHLWLNQDESFQDCAIGQ